MGIYKCDKCSFSCNKKHYFKNHLDTHTVKNNFKCNICSFRCNKYTNFKNHMLEEKKRFENQKQFLKEYEKKSLEGIKKINNIPKVVFVCWFSHKNEVPQFSQARFSALKNLISNIKVPIIILTENNYKNFELENHKFNKSIEYLHGVHKSDYLRSYMLNFYGGGYHDIKYRNESWENCWEIDDWTKNKDIWMFGRREKNENAIAYPPKFKHIQKLYNKMVTMGCIICRPNTKFTFELLSKQEEILDKYFELLQKFPGKKPGGCYFENPFNKVPENSYPLRWCELLGEIYHPLMTIYSDKIKFGLPDMLKKKRYK